MNNIMCDCRNPLCAESNPIDTILFAERCNNDAVIELKDIDKGEVNNFCVHCAEARLLHNTHIEV